MAIPNGTGLSAYQPLRMASLHQHLWAEPRSFDGQDEDHNPRTMDGDSQAMYCSPFLRGSRRQEAQGNASAASEIDTDVNSPAFDRYHTAIRPMTLSRVVTATWLTMLRAKDEFQHYEKLWLAMTDYEKVIKAGHEPKLLHD